MYLNKIKISNFTCFKDFEVEFSPRTTLVIGKNGAGKSSLIRALVYTMNFLFTNDNKMGNGKYLSAGNPDLKMSSISQDEFYRDSYNGTAAEDANFHGEMDYLGAHLSWDMYKKSTSGSALYPSRYVDAYRQFMNIAEVSKRLPLLSYYSDTFPHKMTNLSQFAKSEINNFDGILRNFGYYQWDNDKACTSIWQRRLVAALAKNLSLKDKSSNIHKEVEFVTRKLKEFSRPINVDIDSDYVIENVFFSFEGGETPQLWLKLKDGHECIFDNLPAGYLRLYSMILDLSYRAYLLNRDGDLDNILGLVLIDEIDLHLHPSLEMEVLQRFERTFPNVQIIATTHSPLVITSLDQRHGDRKLIKLVRKAKQPEVVPNIYGIDYNSSLTDFMDAPLTNENVEFTINAIKRLLARNEPERAKERLNKLKDMVSEVKYNHVVNDLKEHYHL